MLYRRQSSLIEPSQLNDCQAWHFVVYKACRNLISTETKMSNNKNYNNCNYKQWSTFGGNLDKINHFNGACKSRSNPKNNGFLNIFKCPYSKLESNNSIGTSFNTKDFADRLQQWFNLSIDEKTDEKWIQFFNEFFFEFH